MDIQGVALPLLQDYIAIWSFLSGLFLGDMFFVLSSFAGAGKLSLWIIFVFGYIGELTHDILFYFMANSRFANFIKKKFKLSKKKSAIVLFLEKLGGKNHFLGVFLAKFIYGVRDVVILYFAHGHGNFKKYFITVATAGFLWMSTIIGAGWLAGRGFSIFIKVFKGFEKILLFLFIAVIIFYLIKKISFSLFWKYIKKKVKFN